MHVVFAPLTPLEKLAALIPPSRAHLVVYEGALDAVQVFWPDRQGRFPFDSECDARVAAAQPLLSQALGRSELEEWRRRWRS
jgi:hypothetical protein